MNFKNVKIFFIILLVAVNIYLLYGYTSNGTRSTHVDEETVSNLTQILGENGIHIDQSTILRDLSGAEIIEAPFDSGYYELVASALSLSEKESVNIMPDNSLRIIMKNGDSFMLDRRFYLEYSSKDISPASRFELEDMIANEENRLAGGYTQSSLSSTEKKLIASLLEPDSITESGSCFSYNVSGVYSNNVSKLVVCDQTIDGITVHSHRMYVELADGRITRAAGTWFFAGETEAYSSELYSQPSVLFEELDYKLELSNSATQALPDTYSITDMDLTYCIYWNSRQDGLFFIPAWRLSTNTGQVRVYNAVSCELYE